MEENISNNKRIVPSYEKKDNNEKKHKKRLFKSRISVIVLIVLLVLVIAAICITIYNVIINNKYKKYESYEEKMNIYGFSKMYNNESPKSSEKVTKSEAVKLIISTLYNLYDISSFAPIENEEYENQIWIEYANDKEILTDEINKDNQNKKISFIDFITILSNAKVNLLEKNLDIEGNPQFSDFEKYTNEQKTAIKDMVWNKIIDNYSGNLNGKRNLSKGEANKILVTFAEKYNTITLNDEDKIVINEEKLPYNYKEYPFVLSNFNKKIYETKFYYSNPSSVIMPVDLYKDEKQSFNAINAIINHYFNTILNIDYSNIDFNEFKQNINSVSMYEFTDDQIKQYVDYVKENKIRISGGARLITPIVYFDGERIRARAVVNFRVIEGNTLDNLIFSDILTGNIYKYEITQKTIYVDVPFEKSKETNNLYISMGSVNKNIAGKVSK